MATKRNYDDIDERKYYEILNEFIANNRKFLEAV